MQDTDTPPRHNETGHAEIASAEASMRLALERLGARSSPVPHAINGRASTAAAGARATPRSRPRFVRDGDVPVVRVPSAPRLPGENGRELAEERAARQRVEEALADAQGTISRLQVARSRTEQALQTAQAAIEEREAAMAGLRDELAHAAQREAALIEAARVEAEKAQAEAKLSPAPALSREPEPVRWWLDYLKAPRS
ncbi:MAG: hypothetical protein ACRYHQ_09490 [Janthinobacterium lividum]